MANLAELTNEELKTTALNATVNDSDEYLNALIIELIKRIAK